MLLLGVLLQTIETSVTMYFRHPAKSLYSNQCYTGCPRIFPTLTFGALFGNLSFLDFISFVAQLSIGIVFEIQHDYYNIAYLRDVLLKDIRIGTVQNGHGFLHSEHSAK